MDVDVGRHQVANQVHFWLLLNENTKGKGESISPLKSISKRGIARPENWNINLTVEDRT